MGSRGNMNTIEAKKKILDFLVELQMEFTFNDVLWNEIKDYFKQNMKDWKQAGAVPKGIVPYVMDLISALSGGSRFVDEAVLEKMFDEEMELLTIFYDLYDEEDSNLL